MRFPSTVTSPDGLPTLGSEWVGLLGAPLGWVLQFFLVYPLTLAACAGYSSFWLHASAFLGLALALYGGFTALQNWRTTEHSPLQEAPEYNHASLYCARLMAMIGTMEGALFGLLILSQWIAILALEPCPQ